MLWLLPLKRYFQFSGRSGRAEFWQFFAFVLITCAISFIIDASSTNQNLTGVPTIMLIAILLLGVPFAAVMCRRLHDRNMSGKIFGYVPALFFTAYFGYSIASGLEGSFLQPVFHLVGVIARLGMFGVLGIALKDAEGVGDPGDNQYGPPPADTAANAPRLHEVVSAVSEKARSFAPPPAPAPKADTLVQLERLAKLYRDGAITDAEFAEQKAQLLGR